MNDLITAFKELDHDNSGSLDLNELEKLLQKSGEEVTKEVISDLFKLLDVDGDG